MSVMPIFYDDFDGNDIEIISEYIPFASSTAEPVIQSGIRETEVLEPLPAETMKVSANVVTSGTTEEGDGSVAEEEGVTPVTYSLNYVTLKANIGDILAKYPDEVIAITVEETNAGMYTGYESSKFYK